MTRSIFFIAFVLAIGMVALSVKAQEQECLPLGVNCWNDITNCCSGYCQNLAQGASFCRERSKIVEPKCLAISEFCHTPTECCSGHCQAFATGVAKCRDPPAL